MTAATVRPTEEWNSADAWAALHHDDTPPHDLASIARAFPHYAEQIAGHPRAYPALVEWAEVVVASRRARPDGHVSGEVGTSDALAAGRRASGAHPLAFSADADAWRAAVAAGAALTQGAERTAAVLSDGAERTAVAQADRASDRVRWTPRDPAAVMPPVATVAPHREPLGDGIDCVAADGAAGGPGTAAGAAPATAPWWADVTPRPAPAIPASAPAASGHASSATTASATAASAPAASGPASSAPASAPAESTHPVAVESTALLGFVFAFVLAPLGIVFSHLALREIGRTGAAGRGYARAGLVIGYAVVALAAVAGGVALSVALSG